MLGVDSSTQSTKALLVDAADGTVITSATTAHPAGTSVDPRAWLDAFDATGGPLLDQSRAVAVGGQQHGMVALDAQGEPVYDALLWNDNRSAQEARDLIDEIGGPQACATAIGSVLVASFTSTKLRWLRNHEPAVAERVHRVLLPHDYVSWHLTSGAGEPFTDRGDASGTGYFDASTHSWRHDLAAAALGHPFEVPRIVGPGQVAATTTNDLVIASGTGDNMAAALGLGLVPGDVVVSIGTSGVASAISTVPIADGTGAVTGFADATGNYLPLVATINSARILDLQARLLGVDYAELSRLALAGAPGANGLTLLPYYDGERTPNRPDAVGTWHGLTTSTTREDLARAAVEALLCSLADAIDHLKAAMHAPVNRVLLIGGGAKNPAIRALAPAIFGVSVDVPEDGEYVALGAARQAAWALSGATAPPAWKPPAAVTYDAESTPHVREAYALLRDRTAVWSSTERLT
ncbi:MAG: xylB [Nocardioidaceae bacterium]|nr:xylB [Nocardioidaceae bacterium]